MNQLIHTINSSGNEFWENTKPNIFPNYEAGTWGPKSADEMLRRDNRKWRLI